MRQQDIQVGRTYRGKAPNGRPRTPMAIGPARQFDLEGWTNDPEVVQYHQGGKSIRYERLDVFARWAKVPV